MDKKNKKEEPTRRGALKRTIMVVPTVMSFTLSELKAQASGPPRPKPYTPK